MTLTATADEQVIRALDNALVYQDGTGSDSRHDICYYYIKAEIKDKNKYLNV
tara:strand:- start:1583 stop:1738 length:156 start_codon:yes stop_codon:yes gene_type:complete